MPWKRAVFRHGNTWSVRLEVGAGYAHKGIYAMGLDDVPHPAAIRAVLRKCVAALRIRTGHKEKTKKVSPQATLW
jgi:hypothetical protein